jgi:sigma-B regulation protein RsbU (phosphoserine phosphatase)
MVIVPLSLVFIVISIFGAVILASVTIKPIRVLSRGAAIIGQGDLDYKIEIKARDELGALAREFNLMTSQIKESKENEIEQRLMQEQLDVARDIQEGLNPMGFYNKGGIQIKGFTRAAKGVGGDYFDYREIGENKIGALLSDVAGKGVPASLVMVMIRTVFTALISRGDVDCAKLVRSINDSMSGDFAIDKFATLFFFVYDKVSGEISFANAGHGPLFCYRAALNACTVTKIDGVPIGIMEDTDYIQAKVKFNPGDIVLVNSDGITEMRNVNKDEYGHQRLQKMLIDNSSKNANDIVETIVNDVDTFRGEASPHDDMTILVFKREF